MFTDFLKYSKQPKMMASFGSSFSDAVASGMFSNTGGTSSSVGYREGQLKEGEKGASFQLPDGTWVSFIDQDPDSASPDPEPPDNPKPKDPPRRGDPDWVDPNPYYPPKPPYRDTPKTEEEKRNERQREANERMRRDAENRKQQAEDKRQAAKEKGGGKSGGGGGGGGGGGQQQPAPPPPKGDTGSPADFSKTGTGTDASKGGIGAGKPANFIGSSSTAGSMQPPTQPAQQASLSGWGKSSSISAGAWGGSTGGNMELQSTPAYAGQSGSNPAQYPAQLNSTPITPSGSSPWITDYNSVGFMPTDPIMGGSYSAPSGVNFSNTQGTNPATQVGISYPLQQDVYDTYSNVTGAEINYMGGSPSFNEATGQYTNVTRNPIANPNTLPTMLSEYDLFGNVGASSGLFLDTPTIKQNAVGTTAAVDTAEVAEPAQGGGLGWVTIGLLALKALSVI